MPVQTPQDSSRPTPPISGGTNGPWVNQLGAMQGQGRYDRLPLWRRQVFERMEKAGRFLDSLIPPPLMPKARALGQLAEFFGPQADIADAGNNYREMLDSLAKGDVRKAISDFGWGLLSNIGYSEVGKSAKAAAVVDPYMQAIFAGVGAKTADHAKLRKAEQLAESGADRQTILNETGWFKGAADDGGFDKWRYEIDDSQARINPLLWEKIRGPNFSEWQGSLADLFDHPELFNAYPDFRDLKTTVRYKPEGARIEGTSGAPSPDFDPFIMIEMKRPFSRSRLKQGLVHEGQHHVQWREGFGSGGDLNSGDGEWKIRRLLERDRQLKLQLHLYAQRANSAAFSPRERHKYLQGMERLAQDISHNETTLEGARYDFYRRLAGEVEARNAARRLDYRPTQRLARPPWETERMQRHRQTFAIPPNL